MKTKTKKGLVYPAYYLAFVLGFVLLLEGFLMGVASTNAWQHGLNILDISQGVEELRADTFWAVEPMLDQVDAVTAFYHQSSTEMAVVLDTSESDPMMFIRGVNDFYHLAAVEMQELLDLSNDFLNLPQTASAAGR